MEVIDKDEDSVGILWDVRPKLVNAHANGMLVEMQWGWDAWATKEWLASKADDSPSGYDSVVMTVDQARDLRDALTAIIDSPEALIVTPENAELKARIDELNEKIDWEGLRRDISHRDARK
jgi:23S rRNA maturation-related 3'-5' exoribonuclease YhaM